MALPVWPPYRLEPPSENMASYTRQVNENFEDLYRRMSGLASASGIASIDDAVLYCTMWASAVDP